MVDYGEDKSEFLHNYFVHIL